MNYIIGKITPKGIQLIALILLVIDLFVMSANQDKTVFIVCAAIAMVIVTFSNIVWEKVHLADDIDDRYIIPSRILYVLAILSFIAWVVTVVVPFEDAEPYCDGIMWLFLLGNWYCINKAVGGDTFE